MDITFFIGNGFDLNIGLNTRYEDFYPYFEDKAKSGNMISSWIDGNECLWSDLEKKLGEETWRILPADTDQFYEDKADLDGLLSKYLIEEQKKFVIENTEAIKKELKKCLLGFYSEFPEEDRNLISKTNEIYKNEDYVYSFISFNYTNTIDRIIDLYSDRERIVSYHQGIGPRTNRIGQIIHIHGTVDSGMILGVNDEKQIGNEQLKGNALFKEIVVKKSTNVRMRQRRTEKTIEVINRSHIICVFGMSIGITDKMWWEIIVDWLISNENNILIIYRKEFGEAIDKKIPSKMFVLDEKIKRDFFYKGMGNYDESYFDKIKSRIMIYYNSGIFSFLKDKADKEMVFDN